MISGSNVRCSTTGPTDGMGNTAGEPLASERRQAPVIRTEAQRIERVRATWQDAFDAVGPLGALAELNETCPDLAEATEMARLEAEKRAQLYQARVGGWLEFTTALDIWRTTTLGALSRVGASAPARRA